MSQGDDETFENIWPDINVDEIPDDIWAVLDGISGKGRNEEGGSAAQKTPAATNRGANRGGSDRDGSDRSAEEWLKEQMLYEQQSQEWPDPTPPEAGEDVRLPIWKVCKSPSHPRDQTALRKEDFQESSVNPTVVMATLKAYLLHEYRRNAVRVQTPSRKAKGQDHGDEEKSESTFTYIQSPPMCPPKLVPECTRAVAGQAFVVNEKKCASACAVDAGGRAVPGPFCLPGSHKSTSLFITSTMGLAARKVYLTLAKDLYAYPTTITKSQFALLKHATPAVDPERDGKQDPSMVWYSKHLVNDLIYGKLRIAVVRDDEGQHCKEPDVVREAFTRNGCNPHGKDVNYMAVRDSMATALRMLRARRKSKLDVTDASMSAICRALGMRPGAFNLDFCRAIIDAYQPNLKVEAMAKAMLRTLHSRVNAALEAHNQRVSTRHATNAFLRRIRMRALLAVLAQAALDGSTLPEVILRVRDTCGLLGDSFATTLARMETLQKDKPSTFTALTQLAVMSTSMDAMPCIEVDDVHVEWLPGKRDPPAPGPSSAGQGGDILTVFVESNWDSTPEFLQKTMNDPRYQSDEHHAKYEWRAALGGVNVKNVRVAPQVRKEDGGSEGGARRDGVYCEFDIVPGASFVEIPKVEKSLAAELNFRIRIECANNLLIDPERLSLVSRVMPTGDERFVDAMKDRAVVTRESELVKSFCDAQRRRLSATSPSATAPPSDAPFQDACSVLYMRNFNTIRKVLNLPDLTLAQIPGGTFLTNPFAHGEDASRDGACFETICEFVDNQTGMQSGGFWPYLQPPVYVHVTYV